ncbi:lysophospholipid acyltransferase family protein [Agarivorans litoreus]|uniref:lysophospholipid acyltransferase family protein n=1 Tax=Agarivorans litoreus TaxID=1510455 RepID=UPI001C7DC019|nr:lysophospholipid acyltransferase family protein [Agarivorans litoreus]
MLLKLLSLIILSFIALSSALFFIIACLIFIFTAPFDKRLVCLHYFTCAWASLYLIIVPHWQVRRLGLQHIDKKQAYVIVSNHQSGLDILLSFALFIPFKWVSKIEMFKVPFVGWNMWLNQYIGLKRGDKHSIKNMLQRAETHLKQGSSAYLFPEGSRSADGKLKPFKLGAFSLAKHAEVAILPIAIHGTGEALPKKSLQLTGHHPIYIQVLPAISAQQVAQMDEQALASHTQQIIAKALAQTPSS